MARKTSSAKNASAPAYVLDVERVAAKGQEIAAAAASVNTVSTNAWDMVRTLFVEAQDNGAMAEAYAVFFGAGDAVKGKKAGWYRGYKSAINNAMAYKIKLDNSMGYSALLAAIKDAKGGASLEKLLEMAAKFVASARDNHGATDAQIRKALGL